MNEVVRIDPKDAAAIVRSGIRPTVLRGTGGNGTKPPVAEIAIADAAAMVRTNTLPKGIKIHGGKA